MFWAFSIRIHVGMNRRILKVKFPVYTHYYNMYIGSGPTRLCRVQYTNILVCTTCMMLGLGLGGENRAGETKSLILHYYMGS